MHIARKVAGAVLALGAVGLPVPAAAAAADPQVEVTPKVAQPGSTVKVSTDACGADVTYGKGTTEAGGDFHLFQGDRPGVLAGEFTVPADTAPGEYQVVTKCPPRIQTIGTVRVAAPHPSGPVDAGAGGTAGTDAARLGLGSALLAGAAAGAAVHVRRRARRTSGV